MRTLVDVLRCHAEQRSGCVAYSFAGREIRFDELWRQVLEFAAALRHHGLQAGDRIVLSIPNGTLFFPSYYGTLAAGCIAVPVLPDSGAGRVSRIASLCAASAIVAADSELLAELARTPGSSACVLLPALPGPCTTEPDLPRLDPEDVCFIQYTSGSTGDPKGVQLSHHNLLTNISQMITGMEITPDDVFVSWLPVSHDMGLILMTMVPFFLPARLVLMPTSMLSIRHWMRTIAEHRGTFTAAPDFAYRIAVATAPSPSPYDLSCLRVALNAAEPVRESTLKTFAETFGITNVMVPGYGLAEATVGVSMVKPGTPARIDARGFVAIGRSFPGVTLEIDSGAAPLASEVGEILVSSPALTKGYYNNPQANRDLFTADGALRTGDLGYVDADDEVFIVGRTKSIIIHAGRTLAPSEVEEVVDGLGFVRRSAAVGVDRGRLEGEQVYVFAELRSAQTRSPEQWPELSRQVVQRFASQLGFRPGRVYLCSPHTLPLTPNGKMQYRVLQQRYLDGTLRRQQLLLWPEY